MEGYWAQAIFRCFYKAAMEMTGSIINEAAVKKVTFLKIRRRTDVFFAKEEINATAVRYCRSSPG